MYKSLSFSLKDTKRLESKIQYLLLESLSLCETGKHVQLYIIINRLSVLFNQKKAVNDVFESINGSS